MIDNIIYCKYIPVSLSTLYFLCYMPQQKYYTRQRKHENETSTKNPIKSIIF